MTTFYIKQNDTRPSLYAQLLQDGSPVDLTDATVKFHMGDVVNAPAVITDAASGNVRYDWQVGDTANSGTFYAEFEVAFPDDKVETFPNDGYLRIIITREVA